MKNKPSKKHLQLLQNTDNQIIRLEGVLNYTKFILSNGKTKMMAYTLKNYQETLDLRFVRVNKSCIINLDYLSRFCTKARIIQLSDGSEIQISRRRLEGVMKSMPSFN
jgi:DNA-binding LytR/AlgR family response regulator